MKNQTIAPAIPENYELLSDTPLRRSRRLWEAKKKSQQPQTSVNADMIQPAGDLHGGS